jgi:hypothetical protein
MDEAMSGELSISGGKAHCDSSSIFNRLKAAEPTRYARSAMTELPADVEYRGYRIVWDARQIEGTSFWTGRAAIVSPADVSGVKSVYKISVNAYFASEEEARDHFIGAAKDRIDHVVAIENLRGY